MTHSAIPIPLALLMLWYGISANASDTASTDNGHILKYGIFDVVKEGKVKTSPDTGTGKIISKPTLSLRQQTHRIPLELGMHFGYQYRLSLPTETHSAKLTRIIRHPEMVKPDGTRSTGSSRKIRERVKNGNVFALDGYALTEPYELVTGEWVFQIWHNQKLLVEQKFITYDADPTASIPDNQQHP